eukprot:gene26761-35447_t
MISDFLSRYCQRLRPLIRTRLEARPSLRIAADARALRNRRAKSHLFFGAKEGVSAHGKGEDEVIGRDAVRERSQRAQLHGYMGQQQCRYGLITTYDKTWFVKIVPAGKNSYAMAISDGVPADYSYSTSQPQTSSSS